MLILACFGLIHAMLHIRILLFLYVYLTLPRSMAWQVTGEGELTYNWLVTVLGGSNVAPNLNDADVVSTSRTQPTLVLNANTLAAGQSYSFILVATEASGEEAQGAVLVSVNSPPTGGAVALANADGNAISQGMPPWHPLQASLHAIPPCHWALQSIACLVTNAS